MILYMYMYAGPHSHLLQQLLCIDAVVGGAVGLLGLLDNSLPDKLADEDKVGILLEGGGEG